ncbi:fumarylacetoacetate hydrolase family protein [Streptomyces sp. Li-HN-5-11]|uniref:fumarylacetoacetate hydrolase family protein n=1 Tax=Streptomyces sp. Li-HN-5-11 TaxID=3075432 RepID=UPI0028A85327|nr:fumarylacetoacetate hydrolase family protein [Streptomyces sp. Li-HN-5-11]WNM34773.1 fumarylacetoacetate hydrolase family protein [Streptomyces sp. Li-HN-5-11]
MRLANLARRLHLITDSGAVDVESASDGRFDADPQKIYARWPEFRAWAETADLSQGRRYAREALGAPTPAPAQLVAVGLNYRDHATETGFSVPDGLPPVFAKFASSLSGPYTTVRLPEGNVDWEVELAVVVGATASGVSEEQAWQHVAGYTVAQDLSERVLQMSGPAPQFSLGKSHAGFTPLGPWLTTLDEIPDPTSLRLTTEVNGEVVQDGTTRDLLFPVPALIARLSRIITLWPGDVILTGTPAGVGMGCTPPRYLAPGDILTTRIEGLGTLEQRFTAQPQDTAE